MRHEQERDDNSWNVKRSSEMTWLQLHSIAIEERVKEIRGAPDAKEPHQDDTKAAAQRSECKKGEQHGNEVAIGCRSREGGGQVRRDDAWNEK